MGVSTRSTLSSSTAVGTAPDATAAASAAPKKSPPGISWSRPASAAAVVECVPPQSLNTHPLKFNPFGDLRSPSVSAFSQEYVPDTLLYEHINDPAPPSMAPL